ncbi:L,D-transpeptidase catalytic domain protein [Acinetobacter sp. ANC 4470]|uniref:L,D-transpeptidase family protein n=1 Tax=Acinetobacter sp. ANC 4470 TaxID=1977881 RepID=UPI000A34CFD2|nr:L,D-transpeptidase family protein [Acinetobacter sp. ANC 4470]OTG66963.1 L,D-transpeptidase catalytic domain protein [Acinetobacter sp. ANC 4470]
MNKKYIFVLGFITLLIMTCGGLYWKYQKFIPTLPNQVEFSHQVELPNQVQFPKTLSDIEITDIRKQTPISSIHVYKAARVVKLLHQDQVIRNYPMRLGFDPIGHKIQEGDGKTPEGRYVIDWRNGQSAFYKSLHISYPNQQDKATAARLGVSAGGDVMIHGSATSKQMEKLPKLMDYMPQQDWTWGCIAVRNVDMDEIWKLVDNGTIIEIYP